LRLYTEIDDVLSTQPIWRPSYLYLYRKRAHCY